MTTQATRWTTKDLVRAYYRALSMFVMMLVLGITGWSGWMHRVGVGMAVFFLCLPLWYVIRRQPPPPMNWALPRWVEWLGAGLGCTMIGLADGPRVPLVVLALGVALASVWLLKVPAAALPEGE